MTNPTRFFRVLISFMMVHLSAACGPFQLVQQGGQDGGGGTTLMSSSSEVREAIKQAYEVAYQPWSANLLYRFAEEIYFKQPKQKRMAHPLGGTIEAVFDPAKVLYPAEKRQERAKGTGIWEYLRLSGDPEIREDEPCPSANHESADASVSELKYGAKICFSVKGLRKIERTHLFTTVLALLLHEIAHLNGFQEKQAVELQKSLANYIGIRATDEAQKTLAFRIKDEFDLYVAEWHGSRFFNVGMVEPEDEKDATPLESFAGFIPGPERLETMLHILPEDAASLKTFLNSSNPRACLRFRKQIEFFQVNVPLEFHQRMLPLSWRGSGKQETAGGEGKYGNDSSVRCDPCTIPNRYRAWERYWKLLDAAEEALKSCISTQIENTKASES